MLLLRDGDAGVEVFMVQRHHQIEFATGALVFPGGKVNQTDFDKRLRSRCNGSCALSEMELAVRIACIREAFEECGVLLANDAKNAKLVSAQRLKMLQPLRNKLECGEVNAFDFINDQDLHLLTQALKPFAHWITPEQMPKRFDTHFFIAAVPPEQDAIHDGNETVDSRWITPRRALEESEAGRCHLMFPTRLNLLRLSQSQTVADALAAARASPIVTVCPQVLQDESGYYLSIPAEAGYDETTQRLP